MARFEPGHRKDRCRDEGEHCLTCGRLLSEIARLGAAIDELATPALNAGYDSSEDYAVYAVPTLLKTLNHRREQPSRAVP